VGRCGGAARPRSGRRATAGSAGQQADPRSSPPRVGRACPMLTTITPPQVAVFGLRVGLPGLLSVDEAVERIAAQAGGDTRPCRGEGRREHAPDRPDHPGRCMMAAADLVVHGGTVATDYGVFDATIVVRDG